MQRWRLGSPVSDFGSLLTKQSFHIIALRLFGAGLALIAQVVASRFIGPEEYGRFALAFVWLLLLGHVGTAGTSQLLYRHLAEYLTTGDKARAAGIVRFAMAATLAVSIAIGVLGIVAVQLGVLPIGSELIWLVTLTLIAVPLLAFQDFLEAIARGLDQPAAGIGPAYTMRHLSIIVGLGALVLVGHSATALTVVVLAIVGFIASILVQYWLLRPHLVTAIGSAAPAFEVSAWLKTAVPMAGVDLAEVLFLNVDVILLGLLVPPEQVAFYFAASRLAQFLAYVPYGVSATTAQKYAALSAGNRRGELQALVSRATVMMTVLTAAGAVTLSVLAAPLLGFFGPEFHIASQFVPVMCLGIVAACALGPGEDVLNMLGEERLCSIGFIVALAVNVVTALVLIPAMGPMGAAIAMALGLAVRGGVLAAIAYWRLGLIIPVFSALMRGQAEVEA